MRLQLQMLQSDFYIKKKPFQIWKGFKKTVN